MLFHLAFKCDGLTCTTVLHVAFVVACVLCLCAAVFQMFGRPKAGITPRMFRRQLHTNFGVRLDSEKARELFDRYDTEGVSVSCGRTASHCCYRDIVGCFTHQSTVGGPGTGSISLQKFVMRVMPKDYTQKLWNVQRDEEADRVAAKKLKRGTDSVYVERMPASLNKVRWTIDKIEKKIQQKIVERTKRASDQYREAYALFGSPQNGISRKAFRHHMRKLGFVLTEQELNALFDKYDSDGSGSITFAELVAHVMPKDYTEKPWNLRRDEEMEKEQARRKHGQAPVLKKWPKSLGRNRMTLDQVEQAIQLKIIERTRRANDQYREAYAMFGSPADGITPKAFLKQLSKLGLVLTEQEVFALFKKYDSDGSGRISFQELVAHVMPVDYTEEPWNIKRDHQMDKELDMKYALGHRYHSPTHLASLVSCYVVVLSSYFVMVGWLPSSLFRLHLPPRACRKTKHFEPVRKQWPSSWGNNRWSVEQIEKAIQQKIIERTKRASDQFREGRCACVLRACHVTPLRLSCRTTHQPLPCLAAPPMVFPPPRSACTFKTWGWWCLTPISSDSLTATTATAAAASVSASL